EAHPVQALLAVNDSGGVLGYVDRGATCLDLALEQPGTGIVDLNGHQPWGKLDHVGLQAELGKGVGRLQSKQAAADNRAYRRRLRRGYNRFQVLDGAIDEASCAVVTGDRRHKGIGAGSQHQLVVGQTQTLLRGDHSLFTIDGDDAVADVHGNAVAG